MIRRTITTSNASSFFIFGARGTGKSTYLQEQFDQPFSLTVDLLKPSEFERYSTDPELLSREVAKLSPGNWILIDEVQRVPALLDLVHYHIERDRVRFAITGSSARKLRRGAANLLAGRAFTYELFPLTSFELGGQFDLDHALRFGTLPHLLSLPSETDQILYLESYASTYIQEEIWNEHLIRILPPFRKFLEVAAQMNGEIINFSKIAKNVGVDDKTVRSYFSILEDTHIGFFIEAFERSVRKQQAMHPKFYFFDTGVKAAIEKTAGNKLPPGSSAYGRAFEHFVIAEIIRLNSYKRRNLSLSFLRTKDSAEIDLVLTGPNKEQWLIEIKSTIKVSEPDITTLKRFHPDFPGSKAICISNDPKAQQFGHVEALHWREFLVQIF